MKGISVNHIQDETITKVGIDFFKYFAQNISQVLKLPIIVITEKIPEKDMVSTLAIWDSTKFRQNKKYNIINSPCEIVSKGYVSVYTEKVCENFPYDMNIKELSVESYIGIPLLGENREFLGHIAAMDRKPITNPGMIIETLKLFAERAVFEISAKKFQEDIKEFFNITEEIMIILDLKGKIRKISPSVEIQLGYLPGEMIFKNLLDYVPEENKKKGKEEFSNFLKHNDTLDFASPLRRKDGSWNWLQWRAVFNRKKN